MLNSKVVPEAPVSLMLVSSAGLLTGPGTWSTSMRMIALLLPLTTSIRWVTSVRSDEFRIWT